MEKSLTVYDDNEKKKAAYALNLCTVSVSQIIDYNDLNVLEQEYEAILNNLNLEQMPKDEALLNILKQLLDTITFFRMEEGDKKIVEKEYQFKMKNAIWNAVPNFGLLVAGGDPVTMAISLASQIGIGYMNYRKQKAQNTLDFEKQMWQLQRSAIEQFNALRRELFDTAWRLSAEYKFEDRLRLTERQIKQYDDILMDSDPIRRYERLEAIKDNFSAYPPFWYYLGNTANQIANYNGAKYGEDFKAEYKNRAILYFEKFESINKYNILREDQLASSCALEHVDLLDPQKDKDKIISLLEFAISKSGNACDVLQLCAIDYLKIGERKAAANLFAFLTNENYNRITNAQFLSSYYVYDYINNKNKSSKYAYDLLADRVDPQYLYPMPQGNEDNNALNNKYLNNQRQIAKYQYDKLIEMIKIKYGNKFNEVIPQKNLRTKESDYFYELSQINFAAEYLSIFTQMHESVCMLEGLVCEEGKKKLKTLFENSIRSSVSVWIRAQICLNDDSYEYSVSDYNELKNILFDELTDEFFDELNDQAYSAIFNESSPNAFVFIQDSITRVCEKEGFPSLEELIEQRDRSLQKDNTKDTLLALNSFLDNDLKKEIDEFETKKRMKQVIADSINSIIREEHECEIFVCNTSAGKKSYQKYFERNIFSEDYANQTSEQRAKKKRIANMALDGATDILFVIAGTATGGPAGGAFALGLNKTAKTVVKGINKKRGSHEQLNNENTDNKEIYIGAKVKRDAIAVLNDKTKRDIDLIFTLNGVHVIESEKIKPLVEYKDISWVDSDNNGMIKFRDIEKKQNAGIDISALWDLIEDLKSISPSYEQAEII